MTLPLGIVYLKVYALTLATLMNSQPCQTLGVKEGMSGGGRGGCWVCSLGFIMVGLSYFMPMEVCWAHRNRQLDDR
jgi:hypothetical protein